MTASEETWQEALHDACFPVTLADVYVGNPSRLAKRYRAVVPVDGELDVDPFAIVTDRYRLIRNEDVLDLGHEAFERLFGPQHLARMTVFNVLWRTAGQFPRGLHRAGTQLLNPRRCCVTRQREDGFGRIV